MRRRGRPAPRVEPCGVWLDTAKLKQRPLQSLLSRPRVSHRPQERNGAGKDAACATQPAAARPRTKQTTISAFFGSQTDKEDKENYRLSPLVLNKEYKEKSTWLAASPVKMLVFPEIEEAQKPPFRAEDEKGQIPPQHLVPEARLSQPFVPGSVPEAEPPSTSEASCGKEEDFVLDFTQDSEGNRILAHRNAAHLFAGETTSASKVTSRKTADSWINKEGHPEEKEGFDFQPGHGAKHSEEADQRSSNENTTADFSETENIDPAIQRDMSWAASFYLSPKRTARAQPLRELSQNVAPAAKREWGSESSLGSPSKHLFTQDSEGNLVISHKCQKVTSPLKDRHSPRRRLINSPYKDCSRDNTNNLSKLEEHWLEMCYDSLFTQDSQGNKVIKH
ncbi:aurora kinase A- and ninein-interacting protein [Eudromia elegans]